MVEMVVVLRPKVVGFKARTSPKVVVIRDQI